MASVENMQFKKLKRQLEEGIDNYNLTVLTAVNEVDNAMSSYLASLQTMDSNSNGLKQSTESFDLSVSLYKQGLTPFTNVVDAQINTLTYANSLTNSPWGCSCVTDQSLQSIRRLHHSPITRNIIHKRKTGRKT